MIIEPGQVPPARLQQYLQHAVAPRPVCFASTINRAGQVNLSPFSFFNLFSSNPPILVFSPSRRVRDNTTKHTLENVIEVPEVVINIVDYPMLHQMSLASCEYPREINEFTKAGFTEEKSSMVKPPMVRESKIKLECRVNEVKPLGEGGGAGNLVIAEVLKMHIDDSVLDQEGMIDQRKLDLVARLGANWYCRANASNIFEVEKPNIKLGIGIDAIPASIRNSEILTGNNLGQLGNVHDMPLVNNQYQSDRLKQIIQYYSINPQEMEKELHRYAKELLDEGKVDDAWQVLLANN
ncbi:MAG TPA: flavin reductase family protein, partial [Ferruginibacter sp.]|nr:flavin reductase family protein [Ferruginibacter sp.]